MPRARFAHFRLAILSLYFLATLPLRAATIHGRVQNIVTGQYLNNARVAVKGTSLVVFTDQTGTYQIPSVPAGPVVLEVFYTDLDPQTIALEVGAASSCLRSG